MTVTSFITLSPTYVPFMRPPPKPHPRMLVWRKPPGWRNVDIREVRVATTGLATTLELVNAKGMVVARVRSI